MLPYQGGKSRISPEISPKLNAILRDPSIKAYYEPFVGGGWMLKMVMTSKPKYASDINNYLIELYRAIQEGWAPPTSISEEQYKAIRANPDNYDPYLVAFTALGASFGNKWFGSYARNAEGTNYPAVAARSIKKNRWLIKPVNFKQSSYADIKPENALVYCDPPYANVTGYSGAGEKFDSEAFWDCMREWSKTNVVLVSEYSAPPDYVSIWSKKIRVILGKANTKQTMEYLYVHESQLEQVNQLLERNK